MIFFFAIRLQPRKIRKQIIYWMMKWKRPRLVEPVQTKHADFLTSFAYDKLSCEYEVREMFMLTNKTVL